MRLITVNSESLTGEPGEQDVREELDRIVTSRAFRTSHRCQGFLQYVVAETLEGKSKLLKERTLAVHVFGRDATGSLSDDSIVRVGAREVRKRLAQYYVGEGANNHIRIELPAGSYIPSFQWHASAPSAHTDLEQAPEPAKPELSLATQHRRLNRKSLILSTAVLALCVVAAVWKVGSAPQGPFETFWQPAFAQNAPVMIAIAHPVVYLPSVRAQQLDADRNGTPNPPIQRAIDVPPASLTGSDFIPIVNQFVGFGDAEAASRLSSLFAQRRVHSRVRLASRMDFNDLRGSGAVLIGAYTNRWTMDLMKNMRYRFEYQAEGKPCIAEGNAGCRWTLTTKAADGRSAEDYILLCRLPHSATSGFTVICAGLNVYGTEEAGRIMSDPESLAPILRKLPKSWADHNLEMVLHVAVVGDAPAQSELLSVYSW